MKTFRLLPQLGSWKRVTAGAAPSGAKRPRFGGFGGAGGPGRSPAGGFVPGCPHASTCPRSPAPARAPGAVCRLLAAATRSFQIKCHSAPRGYVSRGLHNLPGSFLPLPSPFRDA